MLTGVPVRVVPALVVGLVVTSCPWLPCAVAPARAGSPSAADVRARALLETYEGMLLEAPNDAYARRRMFEVAHTVGGVDGLVTRWLAKADLPERSAERRAHRRIVLAHVFAAAERVDDALRALAEAEALAPGSPEAAIAEARLASRLDRAAQAERAYGRALSKLPRGESDRALELRREAATAALEGGLDASGEAHLQAMVDRAPRNVFVWMERAGVLERAGRHGPALAAWLDVVRVARGRLEHLVVAWPRVATLQADTGDAERAEATWREALGRTPSGHWARAGLLDGLVALYRRTDRLQALADELAADTARGRGGMDTLRALASVFEELADDPRALETWRRLVAKRPRDIEAHRRIVSLLERVGPDDALLRAYEDLSRAAPGEPRHALDRAGLLLSRGRLEEGLGALRELARRHRSDPGVQSASVDLLLRYGGPEAHPEVERTFERLIRLEPREIAHVVGLGELLWSREDRDGARAAWRRLLELGRSEADGHVVFAEVLADHGLDAAAAEHFATARELAPDDVRVAKAYARFLERSGQHTLAGEQWRHVLTRAGRGASTLVAREARERLVDAWRRAGRLAVEVRRLQGAVRDRPDHVELGLLLAEALRAAGRVEAREATLRALLDRASGAPEVLRAWAELLESKGPSLAAVQAWEAVATRTPARALDPLTHAMELAVALGETSRALGHARKLVALDPMSPEAHRAVGRLHERLGRPAEAAAAWRKALSLAPTDQRLRLRLAALYGELGQGGRRFEMLSDAVRLATEPGDVLSAGKALLTAARRLDRLEDVDDVLTPLVSRGGSRAHLRLLVDLTAARARSLREAPSTAETATALTALGTRALKPLLDAVASDDVALVARALDVLGATRPVAAAPTLVRALESPDPHVRTRALVALARLGVASSAPAIIRLVGSKDDRAMELLAVWALGQVPGDEVGAFLGAQLRGAGGTTQAWIALALGRRAAPADLAHLRAVRLSARSRAGRFALWAQARAATPETASELGQVVRGGDALSAQVAAWGLARLDDTQARDALADALWSASGPIASALAADALLGGGEPAEAVGRELDARYARLADRALTQLKAPRLDDGLLAQTRARPRTGADAEARLEALWPSVERRVDRLWRGRDRAELVRHAKGLLAPGGGLRLAPLIGEGWSRDVAQGAAERVVAPHLDAWLDAARGQEGAELRTLALAVLAGLTEAVDLDPEAAADAGLAALAEGGPALRAAGVALLGSAAGRTRPTRRLWRAAIRAVAEAVLGEPDPGAGGAVALMRQAGAAFARAMAPDDTHEVTGWATVQAPTASLDAMVGALARLEASGCASVRRQAVRAWAALAGAGLDEAAERLADLVGDPARDVAMAAAEALARWAMRASARSARAAALLDRARLDAGAPPVRQALDAAVRQLDASEPARSLDTEPAGSTSGRSTGLPEPVGGRAAAGQGMLTVSQADPTFDGRAAAAPEDRAPLSGRVVLLGPAERARLGPRATPPR